MRRMRDAWLRGEAGPLDRVAAFRMACASYNASFHSALGMAPNDVSAETLPSVISRQRRSRLAAQDGLAGRRFGGLATRLATLKPGALVRHALTGNFHPEQRTSNLWSKEYTVQKWSSAIYVISALLPTSPIPSYQLASQDHSFIIPTTFSPYQLLLVRAAPLSNSDSSARNGLI